VEREEEGAAKETPVSPDEDWTEPAVRERDRDTIRRFFETGEYPYEQKLARKPYERQKAALQVELLKVQDWVKATNQKVVLLFEGRDAAGKGGTIKRFTEHLNPRGARVVALEKPTEGEQTQWFFQRYVHHLPRGGEIVLFDRSWYNRAGVERVMGFCTPNEYLEFMRQAPEFERMLVRSGIILFKYWFSVTSDEQLRRFESRETEALKKWKISPRSRCLIQPARVSAARARIKPAITPSTISVFPACSCCCLRCRGRRSPKWAFTALAAAGAISPGIPKTIGWRLPIRTT